MREDSNDRRLNEQSMPNPKDLTNNKSMDSKSDNKLIDSVISKLENHK